MKTITWGIVISLLLLGGICQAKELAIIANQGYPTGSISMATLKDIYRGEKTVEGSVKIRPMDQKDPVIKKKFVGEVLGSTLDGYNSYWIKKVFQEGGIPPVVKGSSEEVIQTVGQEAGSLGYVWKSEAAGKGGIKVLLTIDVGE
jgi:ABC-type phosphate transport system substrate-binding protein